MAFLPSGDTVTHFAGHTRIYTLAAGVLADEAVLDVVSIRPPHLGGTLTASVSCDRLCLTGGVPGAEYEVRGPGGVAIKVKAVHQDVGLRAPTVSAGSASVAWVEVPAERILIEVWRPGLAVVQAPGANRARGFDYTKDLHRMGPHVRLMDSTWTSTPDGLVLDERAFDASTARVRVAGGQDGHDYTLTHYWTASDGTKDSRAIIVKVRQ